MCSAYAKDVVCSTLISTPCSSLLLLLGAGAGQAHPRREVVPAELVADGVDAGEHLVEQRPERRKIELGHVCERELRDEHPDRTLRLLGVSGDDSHSFEAPLRAEEHRAREAAVDEEELDDALTLNVL